MNTDKDYISVFIRVHPWFQFLVSLSR
jgi:hypothetical protein